MATLLETASLVMVPSGYEDGTLGSLVPTDASGDFTFTRGSNLSATRVNEDGVIEKGYENLLTYSNDFSNAAWVKSGGPTVTPGQVGYDGSNSAWLLTTYVSTNYLRQSISPSSVITYSVYAKAGSAKWINLFRNGTDVSIYFDLDNGVASPPSSNSGFAYGVNAVGNDWYRCWVALAGSTSDIRIFAASGNNTRTVGTLYIQDAQINQGLVAYPYIETTAAPEKGGILADLPRLDYSSGRASLLLEPQRTNLIEDSEYFADRKYSSTIVVQNYGTSLEGVTNSTFFDKNGVTYARIDFLNINLTPNSYTFSLFVKGNDIVKVRTDGNAGQYGAYIDCATGAVSDAIFETPFDNYYSVDYGNGWFRFVGSVTTTSDFLYHSRIYVMDVAGGEGNTNPATAEIYGFQVEQDATYPTSYIPTYGTSQTRLKDVCADAGDASTFNDSEGVLYTEIATLANDGARSITLSDGGNSNSIYISYNANGRLDVNLRSGGVYQAAFNYTGVANPSEINKIAFKYKQNDFALWVNGVEVGTDSSGITPIGLDKLNFSTTNAVADFFFGNVKQVLYFPTALSDEALIELTTL